MTISSFSLADSDLLKSVRISVLAANSLKKEESLGNGVAQETLLLTIGERRSR